MFFDGTYLYVVNSIDADQTTSNGGKIYKFDSSGAYITYYGASIKWPFSVAVYNSNVFTVATDTGGSGSTGLINLSSSTTPVVTALASPYAVAIDSANGRIYVSDVGGGPYANSVVIYTIGSYGAPLAFVSIGSKPSGIAYDSSLGYMYVTRQSATSAGVYKINTSTNSYRLTTLLHSLYKL